VSHHTIVHPDLIYTSEDLPPREIVAIKGGYLEVSGQGDEKHIERLISTDPKMYLNPKYAPYTKYINKV
jgi:hypothetical protein